MARRRGRRGGGLSSYDDLLAAIEATMKDFNDGDIVEGRVVKVDRDEVLVDIGYRTEGVIPSHELSIKHDVDPSEVVSVGDEVEALVLQKEDKEGRLILSKKRAQYVRAWDVIEEVKEEDGVVTGTVIEVVDDGLILDIGLPAFLPASLVEMRCVRDLQPYVGKEIEAKIIELDRNRNNVVLSRRAWLEQVSNELQEPDELGRLLADKAQTIDELSRQLADQQRKTDELNTQVADNKRHAAELRKQLAVGTEQIRDLSTQLQVFKAKLVEQDSEIDRISREAKAARALARRLWAAMPREGRLAYFESRESWLPEWIIADEE